MSESSHQIFRLQDENKKLREWAKRAAEALRSDHNGDDRRCFDCQLVKEAKDLGLLEKD